MNSTLAMTAALWRAEYPALERSIQCEGLRQKCEAIRGISSLLVQTNGTRGSVESNTLMCTMSTLVIVDVRSTMQNEM
jgi:hypothetical protein